MAGMKIAEYFASIGFKVEKSEIKKVDDFLNKIEKGLHNVGSESEKSGKKTKKSTDETTKAIKQQLTWQEKLNLFKQNSLKLDQAIGRNQKALASNFRKSVESMVVKPSTAKKLKEQQALYNGLFGAAPSKKMLGAIGSNAKAWDRQFQQRIQQLTQQSKVSRRARQADLDSVFGIPKAASNPKSAALINERLGYLNNTRNSALSSMAEMYKQDERISKQRLRDQERRIQNERRLTELEKKRLAVVEKVNKASQTVDRISSRVTTPRPTRSASSYSSANYLHAGGAVGAFARYGMASVPFVGGVYGMSQLNKKNQEIQSAEFGANAIMGEQAGKANMAWLKDQADKVGFDWLAMAPEFAGFMGAATPTMGEGSARNTFQAFNEFATTRHAPDIARMRALYALKQMSSMPNLMSQELFQQIGEAQGFGEVPMMFAEAYAEFTGSGKTGKEALYELKTQMKKGNVKTADVLPLVTKRMSEKAAPTLAQSARSSQAEQNRWRNAVNAQVTNANKNGVEEGFARIWRSFTEAMKESTPLVEKLAKGFNEMSKYMSFAVLLPQSFRRAFEGRDSWVADMLGKERVEVARDLFSGLGELADAIKETLGIALDGWKLIFQEFGDSFMGILGTLRDVFLYTFKMLNSLVKGDTAGVSRYGEAMQASLMGADPETVKAIAEGKPTPASLAAPQTDTVAMAANALANMQNLPRPAGLLESLAKSSMHMGYVGDYDKARNMAIGDNTSPYYQDPAGFDAQAKDMFEAIRNGGFLNGREDQRPPEVTNNITVTVQAVPGQGVDAQSTGDVISTKIKEALQFFNQK